MLQLELGGMLLELELELGLLLELELERSRVLRGAA